MGTLKESGALAALTRAQGGLRRVRSRCLRLADARGARIAPALATLRKAASHAALQERAAAIAEAFEGSPGIAAEWGQELETIRESLEDAHERLAADDDALHADAKALAADLGATLAACRRITIPFSVARRIRRMPLGLPFDFDEEYKREIPDERDREQLLRSLIPQEKRVGGIVDSESGAVYRVSKKRYERVATYLAPALAAAAGAAFLVLVANANRWDIDFVKKAHLADTEQLLGAYALVLIGVLVHLGIENVKQGQSGRIEILAVGRTLNWLHLRWMGISAGVFPALVVVVGLTYLEVGTKPGEDIAFLFAGYSMDSVAGLLLTRFDDAAAGPVKTIKRRLEEAGRHKRSRDEGEKRDRGD